MPQPPIPARDQKLLDRAESFAASAKVRNVLLEGVRDGRLRKRALESPEKVLEARGIDVPPGLKVRFFEPPRRLPARPPEDGLFTIRLTNCRTYWVRKKDGPGFEQVTVCLGIEVIPWRGNPIG